MSEFVKKTIVGYKDVPGGSSDPDCTHVILTLNEYKRLSGRGTRQSERSALNVRMLTVK